MTKPEKGLVGEYFQTITGELKTGKPLTGLEKAYRWSTIASATTTIAIGAYYGGKDFTGKGTNAPKNNYNLLVFSFDNCKNMNYDG
ncbi:hypothetical protein CI088_02860 [Enterococcus plantarum]|uniref:Uncharacterized protein n=1 Tax=Enterococcus plantarum TaxID=1077675 RepID=A0A2W4BTB4_9ENTE|nr:hypothetical protein [Enterococcus plantarum]PZL76459.1 hypothetical protein CI088_02860 [Enterococcus plantarum]